MFDPTADIVFADGPATNPNNPQKVMIRKLLRQYEAMLAAGLSNGGLIYDTKANMNADLDHPANASAWVVSDGANNGIYRKSGASGSGSWTKIADLPYSVVYAQNDGSGTGDAVEATSSTPIVTTAYSQLISIPFTAANTGAMTLSINGETPRPLVTNTGEPIPAGYVSAGMSALVQIDGAGNYRLFSYGDAAAVQAAAEAAQAAAEAAQAAAESAAAGVEYPVSYGGSQTLTDAQQERARNNIGVTKSIDTKALAESSAPIDAPGFVQTEGYSAIGDGGGALYKKVASEPSHEGKLSITLSDGSTVVWYEIAEKILTPQMFGAKGNSAQTLFATNYTTDADLSSTITQQTADGLAFNIALRILRARGGGHLHVPAGTYYIWGYLDQIDFPFLLTGDGAGVTTIVNCDMSPTDIDGYGCLIAQPSNFADITIQDIEIDGNADVRAEPTGEKRCYPLAFYGKVRAKLVNVNCLNSPIDCFFTKYENGNDGSLQAVNCTFDNSFRNTVSLVKGWNQHYTNCRFLRGGEVHDGTNPRYCLDIEPDTATETIRNITFSNCTFQDAKNVVAGGVWAGNVKFNACTFRLTKVGGTGTLPQPWMGYWRGGEFTFTGCSFEDRVAYSSNFYCANPIATGEFANSQFVKLQNCEFEGVAFIGYGLHMSLSACRFRNALYPFVLGGIGVQNAHIRDLELINVFDKFNYAAGYNSSFVVKSDFEGYLDIDGLSARIDPSTLPASLDVTMSKLFGISIGPTLAADCEARIFNVHAAGYYQKYPTLISTTPNVNNFRDWGLPASPPADTSGQTAAPGSNYYRSCTMYGNSA